MCSHLCAVKSITGPGAVGRCDFTGVKTLPQPSLALSYGLVPWRACGEVLQTCGGFLASSLGGLRRPPAPCSLPGVRAVLTRAVDLGYSSAPGRGACQLALLGSSFTPASP